MLNRMERIIISRISPFCNEPRHEKYLNPDEIVVREHSDRLEVFCKKHGNKISSSIVGSNCLLIILRPIGQAEITNFSEQPQN